MAKSIIAVCYAAPRDCKVKYEIARKIGDGQDYNKAPQMELSEGSPYGQKQMALQTDLLLFRFARVLATHDQ